MRLTTEQCLAIHRATCEFFPSGSVVRLFGSRLDDHRRGGDIDLLVETPMPLIPGDLVERRSRFIARLYRSLGEQKIDVLVAPAGVPDDRPVVQTARREGQLLTAELTI